MSAPPRRAMEPRWKAMERCFCKVSVSSPSLLIGNHCHPHTTAKQGFLCISAVLNHTADSNRNSCIEAKEEESLFFCLDNYKTLQPHTAWQTCKPRTPQISRFHQYFYTGFNHRWDLRVLLSQQYWKAALSHTPVGAGGAAAEPKEEQSSLVRQNWLQQSPPTLYISSLPARWNMTQANCLKLLGQVRET